MADINTQNENDPTFGVANSSGSLTPHEIVSGIILIVTGIIFCFFGRRVYRLTLFLIGFYVGTIVALIALTNGEPPSGYGAARETIILVVSLAVGFIVGLIFMCCASVAIWLLGALTGYFLALFILSFKSGGLIESSAGRDIFIIVFTIVGLLLACFFEDQLIILGTAFIGAYAIILGIDLFARTGFSESVIAFMNKNSQADYYNTNTKVYLMLAGMIVLFIIGSIVQFRYYRGRNFAASEGSIIPEKRYNWRNRA